MSVVRATTTILTATITTTEREGESEKHWAGNCSHALVKNDSQNIHKAFAKWQQNACCLLFFFFCLFLSLFVLRFYCLSPLRFSGNLINKSFGLMELLHLKPSGEWQLSYDISTKTSQVCHMSICCFWNKCIPVRIANIVMKFDRELDIIIYIILTIWTLLFYKVICCIWIFLLQTVVSQLVLEILLSNFVYELSTSYIEFFQCEYFHLITLYIIYSKFLNYNPS